MATEEEKWVLLGALYKHGINLEVLQEVLPDWNTSRLEYTIQRYRRRAAKRVESKAMPEPGKGTKLDHEQAALEEWHDVTQRLHQLQGTSDNLGKGGRRSISSLPCDHSPLLSKVMACVAMLEDHPTPTHPGQPNYVSIYRYLSQLIAGDEPTELDSGSAAHVSEMLRQVRGAVEKSDDTKEYMAHLQSLPPQTLQHQGKQGGASRSDISKGTGSSTQKETRCPLFQDPEDDVIACEEVSGGAGVDGRVLKPGDPYYEMKFEKFINMMTEVQQEVGAEMNSVPGLNPLHVPPRLLVKPNSLLHPTTL